MVRRQNIFGIRNCLLLMGCLCVALATSSSGEAGNEPVKKTVALSNWRLKDVVIDVPRLKYSTLDEGLIAHWEMDETDGDVVHDTSGHGQDGRLVEYAPSDKRWVPGRQGNALFLNGQRNYVTFPDSVEALDPRKGDWSISLWLKTSGCYSPRGTQDYAQSVFGKNEGWRENWSLSLCVGIKERPGKLTFQLIKPHLGHSVFGEANVGDGQWHHVVAIRTGQNLKLYVDGRLDGDVTKLHSDGTVNDLRITDDIRSDQPFQLGRYGHHDGWAMPRFEGLMCRVRIYNRVLTKEEIETLASEKP